MPNVVIDTDQDIFEGKEKSDYPNLEAVRGWDKYATRFVVDNQMFEAEISIELVARGDLFYDMTKIKNITPDSRRSMSPTTSQSDVIEGNPSINSISKENENVNSFDENSLENSSNDNIRRSRRIFNREEVSRSLDDVVEMMTVIGNIDEYTFDISVNKSTLISS